MAKRAKLRVRLAIITSQYYVNQAPNHVSSHRLNITIDERGNRHYHVTVTWHLTQVTWHLTQCKFTCYDVTCPNVITSRVSHVISWGHSSTLIVLLILSNHVGSIFVFFKSNFSFVSCSSRFKSFLLQYFAVHSFIGILNCTGLGQRIDSIASTFWLLDLAIGWSYTAKLYLWMYCDSHELCKDCVLSHDTITAIPSRFPPFTINRNVKWLRWINRSLIYMLLLNAVYFLERFITCSKRAERRPVNTSSKLPLFIEICF